MTASPKRPAKKAAPKRATARTPAKKAASKRSVGRPHAIKMNAATLKTLEGLGRIHATRKEGAAMFGVSEPTFIGFLKREKKALEAFEKGDGLGKISLRRAQMQKALDGNSTMLIWMGKQLLGQADKIEEKVDQTVTHEILSADTLAIVDEIRRRAIPSDRRAVIDVEAETIDSAT